MDRFLDGKKVIVVGLGKSGVATVDKLIDMKVDTLVYDKMEEAKVSEKIKEKIANKKIVGYFGGDMPNEKFDILIASPGIPLTEEIVSYGKEIGADIIGELEFAYRLSKGSFVGITGTNGKTTTTTLVGEIFKIAGKDTHVVGNIGTTVTSMIDDTKDDTTSIAEISSFQLETIKDFRAKVSGILNITPDHLNRHITMENYVDAKARIFENQKEDDFLILNKDCELTYSLKERSKGTVIPFSRNEILDEGCFVKDGKIVIKYKNNEETICNIDDINIPGTHNLENVLGAVALCYFSGIDKKYIREGIKAFEGVEHRIEFVRDVNGVRYVNDSKGTNTDASKKAIEAIKENIYLIIGGYDKKEDFTSLINECKGRVKELLILGATKDIIKDTADKNGFDKYSIHDSVKNCIEYASKKAIKGDTVLLSPACASWDMYNSYEERGIDFKNCVNKL